MSERFPTKIECRQCRAATAIVVNHEAQPIADQVKRTYRCEKCGKTRIVFIDVATLEMADGIYERGRRSSGRLESLENCRVCGQQLPCNQHPWGEQLPYLQTLAQWQIDALARIIRDMWNELSGEGLRVWMNWNLDELRVAQTLADSTNDQEAKDGILVCIAEAKELRDIS